MVTEVRLEQPSKALIPMEETPSGMVTEVRLEQPRKASLPMEVTPSVRTTEVILVRSEYQGAGSLVE